MNDMNLNEEQEKEMLKRYETWENYLRGNRVYLLRAFDIYKTNVQYNIEIETDEEHQIIIMWYQDLLDLKKSAFINMPEQIKKYL